MTFRIGVGGPKKFGKTLESNVKHVVTLTDAEDFTRVNKLYKRDCLLKSHNCHTTHRPQSRIYEQKIVTVCNYFTVGKGARQQ